MAPDYGLILLFESVIVASGIVVAFPLVKRHLEKKLPVTYLLMFAGGCQLAAALTSAMSRILRLTGAWLLPDGHNLELLAVTVAMLATGEVFWLGFVLEVFYDGVKKPKNLSIVILYAVLVVVYGIYAIMTGIYVVDITVEIWGLLVALTAPVFLIFARAAWRVSQKVADPLHKRGSQLIGTGPLFLLLTFTFFFADRILGGAFSPFYYIAWISAVIAIFFIYTGYVLPNWLKRLVSGTTHS